ncbi:MAG: asparagine synthetase A [Candidatus Bathyarchaeia archaeon]
MQRQQNITQKSLSALESKQIEIPRPLEQLSETEVKRRKIISKVMTYTLSYLTQKFVSSGFEWLLPVIFSKSTDPLWPDPHYSIVDRIEVEVYGEKVRATLSMIVHKMVACSLAYPKLFTLSPNIRMERPDRAKTRIHAYEFTQLDFEVRNATSRDIRKFVEENICSLIVNLKRDLREELTFLERYTSLRVPEPPFKVYDSREIKDIGDQLVLKARDPFWVVNIPRQFYDYEDFDTGEWDNYDLILPGYGEVLSGARREWEYNKLIKKMERDNIRKENYAVLLKLASEGKLKPSAGAGIGIERLVGWIVGAKHIGETQPFPRIPGIVYDL